MPYYERQPYILPIHQLLPEVLDGEIRVPQFQRKGTEDTWKPEQRGDLLDSIFRGFPVGTILLWSTKEEGIATRPRVGGFDIPPPAETGRPRRLLLDGHQRISTLVQILGPGLKEPSSFPEQRECWVYELRPTTDVSPRDRFLLLKPNEEPTNTQLPLSLVMDRARLNQWIRERRELTDEEIQRADSLRDRLREYSLPVAVLVAEKLEDAAESFKRINSSGTPASDLNMVAALGYSRQFDLYEALEAAAAESLEPIGWGDLDGIFILRVMAGILRNRGETSQHPQRLNADKLAALLRDEGREFVLKAAKAIAKAAELLQQVGVHSPKVLPYTHQMIVSAASLGTEDELTDEQLKSWRRWFWLTTYGNVFQGINNAIYDRAAEGLSELLAGRSPDVMDRDITPRVTPLERFDFRAARTRACILAMARLQDQDDPHGPAHRLLSALGNEALCSIRTQRPRTQWENLAIIPSEQVKSARDALAQLAASSASTEERELLSRLGFSLEPTDGIDAHIEQRRQSIEEAERQLVESLQLQWTRPR